MISHDKGSAERSCVAGGMLVVNCRKTYGKVGELAFFEIFMCPLIQKVSGRQLSWAPGSKT